MLTTCLGEDFAFREATTLQSTLEIGEKRKTMMVEMIKEFIAQAGEVCFQMAISDPALCMDMSLFGQEVKYSSRYQSLDGFIKQNEDCVVILPSIHKVSSAAPSKLGE